MAVTEHRFALRARDDIAVQARRWSNGGKVRAALVVAHGMGEHSGRYLAPLTPIIESGIVAYGLDHRGHGLSAGEGTELGDYGPGGFAGVVADLAELVRIARREQPDVPLILLGHSMGSMISQAYALVHSDEIDGLALSGSAAVDIVAAAAADPSIFANLNASFEPARTPFDWLSRDPEEVDLYLKDPWCGFALQPASFIDLLSQGKRLADPAALGHIRKDLPVYIFSGSRDPLSADLGALVPLIERYRKAGLKVTANIYDEGRHEILNETNRAEVVGDLTAWIERILA